MGSSRGTTTKERSDLERLMRDREKVAREGVGYRAAELKAEVEERLAAVFEDDDARWAEVIRQGKAVAKDAETAVNDQISAICTAAGVPKAFQPQLVIGALWLSRGENASKARRDELRRAAYARIDALAKRAEHEVGKQSVAMRGRIIASGLDSDEAKALLAQMPQPDDLMPSIDIDELQRSVPLRPARDVDADRYPYLSAYTYERKDPHEQ